MEDSYHTPMIKNIPVGRQELWTNGQAFIGIMGAGLVITSANWSYQFLSSLQGIMLCKLHLWSRVPHHQHYWHWGLDNFFLWSFLDISSIYQHFPSFLISIMPQPKCLQTLPNVPRQRESEHPLFWAIGDGGVLDVMHCSLHVIFVSILTLCQ